MKLPQALVRAREAARRFNPSALHPHVFDPKASAWKTGLYAKQTDDAGAAELYVYEQIGEDFWTGGGVTAKSVAEALKKLDGAKTLAVYINSPGGDAFEGLAIYEQLKRCKAEVTCYVDGIAASAASVVAMGGKRCVMAPAATMMVHKAWSIALGNSDDMRAMADVLDTLDQSIAAVYCEKTGKSREECLAMMAGASKGDDGTWMTADEAVAAGLADEVSRVDSDGDDDGDKKPDGPGNLVRLAAQTQRRIAAARLTAAKT